MTIPRDCRAIQMSYLKQYRLTIPKVGDRKPETAAGNFCHPFEMSSPSDDTPRNRVAKERLPGRGEAVNGKQMNVMASNEDNTKRYRFVMSKTRLSVITGRYAESPAACGQPESAFNGCPAWRRHAGLDLRQAAPLPRRVCVGRYSLVIERLSIPHERVAMFSRLCPRITKVNSPSGQLFATVFWML
jgi:hypothetical protein